MLQNSQEKQTVLDSLFGKVIRFTPGNRIKKRIQQSCFPVNFVIFQEHLVYRTLPVGCFWMLYHWGFLSRAKPDPDFARPVIACHCFYKALYFNCSYLISKVTISYLFAGKCLLLISIKIFLLNLFQKQSPRGDLCKKVFLEISQISQENTCARPQACNFIKKRDSGTKRPWHRFFTFFTEHLWMTASTFSELF